MTKYQNQWKFGPFIHSSKLTRIDNSKLHDVVWPTSKTFTFSNQVLSTSFLKLKKVHVWNISAPHSQSKPCNINNKQYWMLQFYQNPHPIQALYLSCYLPATYKMPPISSTCIAWITLGDWQIGWLGVHSLKQSVLCLGNWESLSFQCGIIIFTRIQLWTRTIFS